MYEFWKRYKNFTQKPKSLRLVQYSNKGKWSYITGSDKNKYKEGRDQCFLGYA